MGQENQAQQQNQAKKDTVKVRILRGRVLLGRDFVTMANGHKDTVDRYASAGDYADMPRAAAMQLAGRKIEGGYAMENGSPGMFASSNATPDPIVEIIGE